MVHSCNVLSIDFDYFLNVKQDDICKLPDGNDKGIDLSMLIWSSYYCTYNSDFVKNITVDEKKISYVKTLLKSEGIRRKSIPTMIVDSHRHIFDFVRGQREKYQELRKMKLHTALNIYNLDYHHDTWESNHGLIVDCGNWNYMFYKRHEDWGFEDFNSTWIANKESRRDEISKDVNLNITEDIHCLDHVTFDIIFLCLSSAWVPPHLYKKFVNLANVIKNSFDYTYYENDILTKANSSMKTIERYGSKIEQELDLIRHIEQYRSDRELAGVGNEELET